MAIFEGAISVKAILESNNRKIDYIWIDKNKKDRNTNYIINKAKNLNVLVEYMNRENIDNAALGKTHGGIICSASVRKYNTLKQCLSTNSFICVIDGIEDPYNLGYALRCLYSFGCTGVILPFRDLSKGDSTMVKSSAGASEKIKLYLSENLKDDLLTLKNNGLKIISMQRDDQAQTIYDTDFSNPFVLVLGGEKRGITKDILSISDKLTYIPYSIDFKNALNATTAIASVASEIQRQRNNFIK